LRLDKLLYFLRITKTRSMAQTIIETRPIRVDGKPVARVHESIQVGQVITLALGDNIRVIRITTLPNRRGPPAEAQACFDDLSPSSD
jgi:ribosome-associated heat shock protein Hsp15